MENSKIREIINETINAQEKTIEYYDKKIKASRSASKIKEYKDAKERTQSELRGIQMLTQRLGVFGE